jgi:hypothetical protein
MRHAFQNFRQPFRVPHMGLEPSAGAGLNQLPLDTNPADGFAGH